MTAISQRFRINLLSLRSLSMFAIAATLLFAVPSQAAEEPPQVILRDTINSSFGKVWKRVKELMKTEGCGRPQTEKIIEPEDEVGFYKGIYVSDFCMLVTGEDSTKGHMEAYGKIPRIRGGIWITGRVQYKVNVKEIGVRQTMIIVRAELSGFEEFITNRIYFWTSNGKLEEIMMAAIIADLDGKKAEE